MNCQPTIIARQRRNYDNIAAQQDINFFQGGLQGLYT